MGEGRNIVAMMVVLGMLVILSDLVDARTYVVGKKDGSCSEDICWTFNVTRTLLLVMCSVSAFSLHIFYQVFMNFIHFFFNFFLLNFSNIL